VKVVVLTTSYPRDADDVAGAFVRDGVDRLRAAGHDVVVVSPASFRHFGIAYGDGIVNNLRSRPWKLLLLPAFLVSFAAAARRAAVDAEVVHAHWLPSALPAVATRRPFVLQLWGSDVEFAPRLGSPARWLVRRARVVVVASTALAVAARDLGAVDVRVIPNGVDVPGTVAAPEEPPHVLYVGRLSEEKGVRELASISAGLPLVVVGDGPLRSLLPEAVGFVSPSEVGAWYERASIVVVPSRREGYGVVAREAMAYGRPVVATRVGGLVDVIEDDVTGLLVEPGDLGALREALDELLGDAPRRRRLGDTGRARVAERLGWDTWLGALEEAYAACSGLPPAVG
jgi:glycosyltransferase involved in cell wall biosynthesis